MTVMAAIKTTAGRIWFHMVRFPLSKANGGDQHIDQLDAGEGAELDLGNRSAEPRGRLCAAFAGTGRGGAGRGTSGAAGGGS